MSSSGLASGALSPSVAASPFAPGTNVWDFNYTSWFPHLKTRTVKSVTLPLTRAQAAYFLADGVDVPDDVFHIDKRYVVRVAKAGLHSTRAVPAFLPDFARSIETAVKELGGAVFPKLSWSSPQDARWITLDGTLRCENARDVLVLLKASAACATDLVDHPSRPVMASAQGWGPTPPRPAPIAAAAADSHSPVAAAGDDASASVDSDVSGVIYDENHPDYDPLRALLARAKRAQAADDAATAAAVAESPSGAAPPSDAELSALYGPDALTLEQRLGPLLPPPSAPSVSLSSSVANSNSSNTAAESDKAAIGGDHDGDDDGSAASPFALVLKKWSTLHPWRELRVFVVHGRVVALSQRDDEEHDELQRRAARRKLKRAVLDFHEDHMTRPLLRSLSEEEVAAVRAGAVPGGRSVHYCYDVYVDTRGKVFVLDVGPLGPDWGATALVDWDRHLAALIAAGEADAAAHSHRNSSNSIGGNADANTSASVCASASSNSQPAALGAGFAALLAEMSALEAGKEADIIIADTASSNNTQQPENVIIPGINDDEDDSDFETEDRDGAAIAAALRAGRRYPVPMAVVTAATARAANQRATVAAVRARLPADRADLTDTDAIEKLIREQKALGNVQAPGGESETESSDGEDDSNHGDK